MWAVLIITLISHFGLIFLFEKQRKKIELLRALLKRQRATLHSLESQLRFASERLRK